MNQQQTDKTAFVARFGGVFRNGDWIAERAFAADPSLANAAAPAVTEALCAQFRAGSAAERLEVVKSYGQLNPRIEQARIVTDPAQSESLDMLTAEQKSRLLALLGQYVETFGFGVIFAVRDYTTASLLAALEARLGNSREAEMLVTYREVERLAGFQVEARFAA